MVAVGRDLCGSSSPTLLLKQGASLEMYHLVHSHHLFLYLGVKNDSLGEKRNLGKQSGVRFSVLCG